MRSRLAASSRPRTAWRASCVSHTTTSTRSASGDACLRITSIIFEAHRRLLALFKSVHLNSDTADVAKHSSKPPETCASKHRGRDTTDTLPKRSPVIALSSEYAANFTQSKSPMASLRLKSYCDASRDAAAGAHTTRFGARRPRNAAASEIALSDHARATATDRASPWLTVGATLHPLCVFTRRFDLVSHDLKAPPNHRSNRHCQP